MKIRPLVLIIGVAIVGSLLAQEIHKSLSGSAIHTPNKIQ
jgi:hypothetical protein